MTEAIQELKQPVEDAVLLRDGEIEVLTGMPEFLIVSTQAGHRAAPSAGVLIR